MNFMDLYQYPPGLMAVHGCGDTWRQSNFSQPASSSELTRDGTHLPGDSQEPSTIEAEDTFGLEFAAVQWLNLVTNAEELFNKLLHSIVLSGDEKEQIQRWLCLKQECEECVASDEATSFGDRHRHSLERIEELTEDTEQTGAESSDSTGKLSDSQYESETESDFDSHYPDFEDKLDGYMERFKDATDTLIRTKFMREETKEDYNERNEPDLKLGYTQSPNPVFQKGRRKSLHPGAMQVPMNLIEGRREDMCGSFQSDNSKARRSEYQNALTVFVGASSSPMEPYKELKMLSSENDAKKTQIKQVLMDLEGAHKRMEELEHTIQIKEQFIKEMIRNSETRASAKLKFQRKWSKLEEEYYKTRTQLAQAENALRETRMEGAHDSLLLHKSEVEKYKNLARHYEKRLKDIDMIKQIAGDSAKKVLELEDSLHESKKQMEKLKKQLQKEEMHKLKLEQELIEDQQKMRALEEKYNLQVSKLLDKDRKEGAEASGDGDRLKWITEETERLTVMRESSQKLHQQLVQQQMVLDKREAFMKETVCMEKQRTKNILEVSARISHLEHMLKEKSSTLEKTDEKDEKEALRQEIRNLRTTRDCLLDQRSSLDEKYQKDQTLSSTEERTRLECEEAIEAIDAAIEYKNELICGRKGLDSEEQRQREQGEQMLMERLLKLSPDEMRTLLYKYFQKVIDLRESGRKMEQQLYEVEHQNDDHVWRIQDLTHALQAQRLEAERQKVALQRDHQEKLHLMLRHFAEESGSSGTEAGRHLVIAKDNELGKVKRENKHLKRRLQEMEALMQAAAASRGVMRLRSRSASPDPVPFKQLPPAPSTTKVTREKNKVIIRLNAPKKKSSNKQLLSFTHSK